ncbi:MAG: hypothetical protein INR69_07055 [Mucilaginibacter polytrichastri]|nr:hypothetical protein [Mucilaginibacter polytrichastri]
MKVICIILILSTFASCKRDQAISKYSCNTASPVIRKAAGAMGRIRFDSDINARVIVETEAGTIDTQNRYVLCGGDFDLPDDDTAVVFSGDVRNSSHKSGIGVTTYYEITLSSITRQ